MGNMMQKKEASMRTRVALEGPIHFFLLNAVCQGRNKICNAKAPKIPFKRDLTLKNINRHRLEINAIKNICPMTMLVFDFIFSIWDSNSTLNDYSISSKIILILNILKNSDDKELYFNYWSDEWYRSSMR